MLNLIGGQILSALSGAFQWIIDPQNRTMVLGIAIALLVSYGVKLHGDISGLEQRNHDHRNNLNALSSELVQYRDSLGGITAQRGALRASVSELKELNLSLYNTIDSLEANPTIITHTEYVIRRDTLTDIDSAARYLGENGFEILWDYAEQESWGDRFLSGRSQFRLLGDTTIVDLQTDIVRDEMSMDLTLWFEETEEGYLKSFARTSNPYVTFNELNSSVINPENYVSSNTDDGRKKRWGIGPEIGYGYSLIDGRGGAYVGFGIHYSFIRF